MSNEYIIANPYSDLKTARPYDGGDPVPDRASIEPALKAPLWAELNPDNEFMTPSKPQEYAYESRKPPVRVPSDRVHACKMWLADPRSLFAIAPAFDLGHLVEVKSDNTDTWGIFRKGEWTYVASARHTQDWTYKTTDKSVSVEFEVKRTRINDIWEPCAALRLELP
jgi:hypothetical protein